MKIPISCVKKAHGEVLLVTTRFQMPRVYGNITFIVDTGCPFSFIGAVDSERLNIKIAGKRPIEYVAWGDKMIKLFQLNGSEIHFIAEDNEIEKLRVIRHRKLKATLDFVETRGKKDSPSVLGMDFVTENGLKLVLDGSSKRAWFEV